MEQTFSAVEDTDMASAVEDTDMACAGHGMSDLLRRRLVSTPSQQSLYNAHRLDSESAEPLQRTSSRLRVSRASTTHIVSPPSQPSLYSRARRVSSRLRVRGCRREGRACLVGRLVRRARLVLVGRACLVGRSEAAEAWPGVRRRRAEPAQVEGGAAAGGGRRHGLLRPARPRRPQAPRGPSVTGPCFRFQGAHKLRPGSVTGAPRRRLGCAPRGRVGDPSLGAPRRRPGPGGGGSS